MFTIDLDKIKRDREFTCPLYKVTIYHDDESGSVYKIVSLTIPNNGLLKEMSIVYRRM